MSAVFWIVIGVIVLAACCGGGKKTVARKGPYRMQKPMNGIQSDVLGCTVNYLFYDNISLYSIPTQPKLVAQASFDRSDKAPITLFLIRPDYESDDYTTLLFSTKVISCSDRDVLHVFSYGALLWKEQMGSFPKGLSKSQLHAEYADKVLLPNELDFIPPPLALLASGQFDDVQTGRNMQESEKGEREKEVGYLKTRYASFVFPFKYSEDYRTGDKLGINGNGYDFRFVELSKMTRQDLRQKYGSKFDNYELEEALYLGVIEHYKSNWSIRFIREPMYYTNDKGAKFVIVQYIYNNTIEDIPLYTCVCYTYDFEMTINVEPRARGEFEFETDMKLIKHVLNTMEPDWCKGKSEILS